MKTKTFKTLFVLLISLPFGEGWGGVLLSAQNGVTVSGLKVTAGSPTTVTFEVNWDKSIIQGLGLSVWSDTVWVFVDYNDAGAMKRLPLITSGATLTTHTAPGVGKVIPVSGNDDGVWVVGNARSDGNFSATVQLLTATAAADFSGVCAYASNYPPVGEYTTTDNILFTGTPAYDLVLEHENGSTMTVQSGSTFPLQPGYSLQSFTDKTGAPGMIYCLSPDAPTVAEAIFCAGLSGQLVAASPSSTVTMAWYNTPTGGNPLVTGNVLPLKPYNASAQYYVEAIGAHRCASARTQAVYTVNNCVINGSCPGFAAGSVGSGTAPEEACSVYDSGRIGQAGFPVACLSFDAGQIGLVRPPAACMSYSAGWIGN
jgi:hypothetical protein